MFVFLRYVLALEFRGALYLHIFGPYPDYVIHPSLSDFPFQTGTVCIDHKEKIPTAGESVPIIETLRTKYSYAHY